MPLLTTSGAASVGAFGFGRGSGGTTWNPSDKSVNVVLSNGNLTAATTAGVSASNVRSTTSKTAGAWQAEITVGAANINDNNGIAVGNSAAPLNSFLNSGTTSIVWTTNGRVYLNGVSLATIESYAAGDTVAVQLDAGADQVYFQKFGSPRRGPYAIAVISGAKFIMAGLGSASSNFTFSANFGRSPFLVPLPPGYLAWNR